MTQVVSQTWVPPVAKWPLGTDTGSYWPPSAPDRFVERKDIQAFDEHWLWGRVPSVTQTLIPICVQRRASVYPDALLITLRPLLRSAQVQVQDIQRWTGWSDRRVATLIASTHPTVARLRLEGAAQRVRNKKYRSRLERLHQLVSRIHVMAGFDADRTRITLEEAEPGRASAIQLIEQGRFGEAYLAAARKLGSVAPAPRMSQSGRTTALDEPED
jgi:hypothetical protein